MQGYPPPGGYGSPGGYGAPPGPPGYGPPPGGFAPPPGGGFGGPPGGGSAQAQIGPPAIGLIATAVIGILAQLGMLVLRLLGTGFAAMGAASGGGFAGLMSGVVGIVFTVIWLLMGGVVLFGAMKMQKLQSYGLSMAAAIIAALPCTSPCCFLGLPIGIWAIVVLMNQNVKASFTG